MVFRPPDETVNVEPAGIQPRETIGHRLPCATNWPAVDNAGAALLSAGSVDDDGNKGAKDGRKAPTGEGDEHTLSTTQSAVMFHRILALVRVGACVS